MEQTQGPGCLKAIGFLFVVIFVGISFHLFLEGIGNLMFSIPWFIWILLVVGGVYLYNKIFESK